MSASSNNITALSSKKVEELGKKYKSENTEELILKGFVVYWLQDDIQDVKIKAEDVQGAEEPNDELPDPENPDPPAVEKVVRGISNQKPLGHGKMRSHFLPMYAPVSNATMIESSSYRHGYKR